MSHEQNSFWFGVKSNWYLWLFPVMALLIAFWLLYNHMQDQGPRIQVSFDDAASIQSQKTKVRFRGVVVGTVVDVFLSEDQKQVIAEILLKKQAKQFAVEGSKFSLVTPSVNFQGISGLDTIMEGSYIEVLPGQSSSFEKLSFRAMSSSASTEPLDGTSAYLLETDNIESVSLGDAVTFRGMKVGSVTKLSFVKGAQSIQIQISVENKFVYLIRASTVFWKKVGIQANLGLFGSEIKVNSMDSIMNGGVEFATPSSGGTVAKAMQKFPLLAVAPKKVSDWRPFLD